MWLVGIDVAAGTLEVRLHPESVASVLAELLEVRAKRDPATAWADFRAHVEMLGGIVVEPKWLGLLRPHRVICAEGHACAPYPTRVFQGVGICRTCAGKVWDRFYVVVSPSAGAVKFGVTSGDVRSRLHDHRVAGYAEVIRLLELVGADELERATLGALRLAELSPVKGREYFDLSALPVILDVVDHWPGARPL
jgi:hypothetical protein